jgi:hypothetical protein
METINYESHYSTLPPQRREPNPWHFDDPPTAIVKKPRNFMPDPVEAEKLEATKRFGGLIPQRDVELKKSKRRAAVSTKRA